MELVEIIFIGVVIVIVGVGLFFLGWFLSGRISANRIKNAEEQARKIIEQAQKEAETYKKMMEVEMKDELYKLKQNFEKETKNRRAEIQQLEKTFSEREAKLDRKVDLLSKKEKSIQQKERELTIKEKSLQSKEEELAKAIQEENAKLERIAGLTAEEAKAILISNLEATARLEAAAMIKDIKEKAKETAEKEAKEIITIAIQRCATEQVSETTVSVVPLPSDEMKGRIIGREGRNIRAFESATGIDVIIDDTPEAVILSGFDPIRREIAKVSLEKLINDGRIHPGRIEDIVVKTEKEINEMTKEIGEQACEELNITNMNPVLIRMIGRLKYRTSYGQNVLQHSKDVAYLAGMMASELGFDYMVARRAGLLHDIGKAADREMEGTHVQIGAELAKKYGESEEVINAIAAHHQDIEFTTPIAVLVQAADAISGSRPGARRETLEAYIKRLEKLEEIACSFPGVEKTYAIQAGREIRVMVQQDKIDDAKAYLLAQDISKKIEKEMEYPGQIKVVVIREVRAVEYAK